MSRRPTDEALKAMYERVDFVRSEGVTLDRRTTRGKLERAKKRTSEMIDLLDCIIGGYGYKFTPDDDIQLGPQTCDRLLDKWHDKNALMVTLTELQDMLDPYEYEVAIRKDPDIDDSNG